MGSYATEQQEVAIPAGIIEFFVFMLCEWLSVI